MKNPLPPGAISAAFEVPGMTAAQYDQVMANLEAAGAGAPSGRLYHIAGPRPDGWFVLDVWTSGEALNHFAGTLMPILQQAGVTPTDPKVYPVHHVITS